MRTALAFLCAILTPPALAVIVIGAWQRTTDASEWFTLALASALFGLPTSGAATVAFGWPILVWIRSRRPPTFALTAGVAAAIGALVLPAFALALHASLADAFGGSKEFGAGSLARLAPFGTLAGAAAGAAFWFTGGSRWASSPPG